MGRSRATPAQFARGGRDRLRDLSFRAKRNRSRAIPWTGDGLLQPVCASRTRRSKPENLLHRPAAVRNSGSANRGEDERMPEIRPITPANHDRFGRVAESIGGAFE